jgi:hypothetical protein
LEALLESGLTLAGKLAVSQSLKKRDIAAEFKARFSELLASCPGRLNRYNEKSRSGFLERLW